MHLGTTAQLGTPLCSYTILTICRPFEAVGLSVPCMLCVFPGAPEPSRELGCAEALGRAPVLPAGQPEVQSHPCAALPGLLLQSGRNAPQVRNSIDAVVSLLYIFRH